jgi:hypothetical protein
LAIRQQAENSPAAEWRVLVLEWERGGKTRRAFATSRGLVPSTLAWWIGKLRRLDREAGKPGAERAAPAFLPVRVEAPAEPVEAGPDRRHIEIALAGGDRIRVPVGVDAAWTGPLVAVLPGGAGC